MSKHKMSDDSDDQAEPDEPDEPGTLTVYCTGPKTMYEKPEFAELVSLASDEFPDEDYSPELEMAFGRTTEVISAGHLFGGGGDWEREWAAIRDEIDVLLFITDEAGVIGKGVYEEIQYIKARGKEVCLALVGDHWKYQATGNAMDGVGPLQSLDDLRISVLGRGGDWAQYAKVEVR